MQTANLDAIGLSGVLFGLNLHAIAVHHQPPGSTDSVDGSDGSESAIQKWSLGDNTLHFTHNR